MSIDRRAILCMVAAGRMTAAEADRLLSVWTDKDEAILRFAVCAAVAWLVLPEMHQFFSGLEDIFRVPRQELLSAVRDALAYVPHLLGGIL